MKIGYLDCFAGAGGDMIVAAMLDAGLDSEYLAGQIDTLGLEGVRLDISRVKRCGVSAGKFEPVWDEGHHHHHRGLSDIVAIINASGISKSAKERAVDVFGLLGEAEAKVHGVDVEKIHFHEVGAVDSIVDIVSACVGFDALGLTKVYCSELSVGAGTVKCAHGVLPVPAPATLEILQKGNAPFKAGPGKFEMLTPTAAALLVNFADGFGSCPAMTAEAIGYGAGSKDSTDFANVVRLVVGEGASADDTETDCVVLLETNIDDATGEVVGFVSERLMTEGALDVSTTAIGMKRGRSGVKMSVICELCDDEKMQGVLFGEGLTFGVRRQIIERRKLRREFITVKTEFGEIQIKTGYYRGKQVIAKPEYCQCREGAKKYKTGIKMVSDAAMRAFWAEKG